jgi:hypothetical protein
MPGSAASEIESKPRFPICDISAIASGFSKQSAHQARTVCRRPSPKTCCIERTVDALTGVMFAARLSRSARHGLKYRLAISLPQTVLSQSCSISGLRPSMEKRRRKREVFFVGSDSEHFLLEQGARVPPTYRQQYERSHVKREQKIAPRHCARPLDLQNKIREATYPPLSLPSPGRFLPDLDRRRKPHGPFSWKTDCWKKRKQVWEIEQY